MGTEILIIFLPIPFVFLAWNIWQMTMKESRKKGILLFILGLAFMLYMVLPITTQQYFVQELIFSGVIYPVFYLFAWLIVSRGLIAYERKNLEDR